MNGIQAFELAYGKGNLKKWALEQALIEVLYETKIESPSYLKLENLDNLDFDEEAEREYIVKFGYLYRIPRTEIDLHIIKKTGKMYLTKGEFGWGYDKVEKQVVEYLFKQKKNKNLYFQTNYNWTKLLVK